MTAQIDIFDALSANEEPPVVDLFAGPGGWSQGLSMLDMRELGFEIDPLTCATARAAGHLRVCADVAELDPRSEVPWPVVGLIGSPPCPGFSGAGTKRGRDDFELCEDAARRLVEGDDARAELRARCRHPDSMMVVEPLRWALALEPEWIALEQVPSVLRVWELLAELFAPTYSVAVGVVNAADFGVAQTRERAVLLASRVGTVRIPDPTHPTPATMADVLPWAPDDLVGFPRRNDRPTANPDDYHRWRDRRPASKPAFTLTEKARSWTRVRGANIWRVSVEEASTLQGFPADYPWQGSRSARFHQIGNAVPPPMARTLLAQVVKPS